MKRIFGLVRFARWPRLLSLSVNWSTRSTAVAHRTLLLLADLSIEFGLIDISEHIERRNVALWLADDEPCLIDPRELAPNESREEHTDPSSDDELVRIAGSGRPDDPGWFELLVLREWLFTRSDPDPYPSTPHGHLYRANRAWPKLSPYTGRVFKAKHQEHPTLRLTKREMRELWRMEAFRDFCRSYILSYIAAHPYHEFAVKYPLRFPRW